MFIVTSKKINNFSTIALLGLSLFVSSCGSEKEEVQGQGTSYVDFLGYCKTEVIDDMNNSATSIDNLHSIVKYQYESSKSEVNNVMAELETKMKKYDGVVCDHYKGNGYAITTSNINEDKLIPLYNILAGFLNKTRSIKQQCSQNIVDNLSGFKTKKLAIIKEVDRVLDSSTSPPSSTSLTKIEGDFTKLNDILEDLKLETSNCVSFPYNKNQYFPYEIQYLSTFYNDNLRKLTNYKVLYKDRLSKNGAYKINNKLIQSKNIKNISPIYDKVLKAGDIDNSEVYFKFTSSFDLLKDTSFIFTRSKDNTPVSLTLYKVKKGDVNLSLLKESIKSPKGQFFIRQKLTTGQYILKVSTPKGVKAEEVKVEFSTTLITKKHAHKHAVNDIKKTISSNNRFIGLTSEYFVPSTSKYLGRVKIIDIKNEKVIYTFDGLSALGNIERPQLLFSENSKYTFLVGKNTESEIHILDNEKNAKSIATISLAVKERIESSLVKGTTLVALTNTRVISIDASKKDSLKEYDILPTEEYQFVVGMMNEKSNVVVLNSDKKGLVSLDIEKKLVSPLTISTLVNKTPTVKYTSDFKYMIISTGYKSSSNKNKNAIHIINTSDNTSKKINTSSFCPLKIEILEKKTTPEILAYCKSVSSWKSEKFSLLKYDLEGNELLNKIIPSISSSSMTKYFPEHQTILISDFLSSETSSIHIDKPLSSKAVLLTAFPNTIDKTGRFFDTLDGKKAERYDKVTDVKLEANFPGEILFTSAKTNKYIAISSDNIIFGYFDFH
jgi:hypothetical protein